MRQLHTHAHTFTTPLSWRNLSLGQQAAHVSSRRVAPTRGWAQGALVSPVREPLVPFSLSCLQSCCLAALHWFCLPHTNMLCVCYASCGICKLIREVFAPASKSRLRVVRQLSSDKDARMLSNKIFCASHLHMVREVGGCVWRGGLWLWDSVSFAV